MGIYSEFSHSKWLFSMAMLNYQRVYGAFLVFHLGGTCMLKQSNGFGKIGSLRPGVAWCSYQASFRRLPGSSGGIPYFQIDLNIILDWFDLSDASPGYHDHFSVVFSSRFSLKMFFLTSVIQHRNWISPLAVDFAQQPPLPWRIFQLAQLAFQV